MSVKKVQVAIPADVWGKLASIADDQGVRVGDVIVSGIRAVLPMKRSTTEQMHDLVRTGFPDAVVAHRTGFSIESVRGVRRSMGFRAPKFNRSDWPELVPGGANEGKAA